MPRRQETIDLCEVLRRTREKQSAREIANALGFTQRTIVRARSRMRTTQYEPRRLTPDELHTIKALAADHVPGTWIAETVGRCKETIYRVAPTGAEPVSEWKHVWSQIRQNPVLLELHREFAPKKTKVSA